jgi:flagellar biosynthetic protein FlhB
MAADDAERTEQPTPRRIQRARQEGNVIKTVELNSAAILFTGTILLYLFMSKIVQEIISLFRILWGEIPTFNFTVDNFQRFFAAGSLKLAFMLGPLLLALLVIGIVINIIQSGWLFTTKTLQFRLNRINPINGFGRLFSARGAVELLKNILKVLLVGLVAYWTIKADFQHLVPLIDQSLGQIVIYLGKLTFKVALRTTFVILLLAILDYIWVRYRYMKDLRMTKQEVKEEHRQAEGPPEVRSAIRRIQLRTAVQRMMREVPTAEVVITNPTHLAVALKYEAEQMSAPVVVAKGARLVAEKIKKIALENDIPIVENQPLAQALYKSVEIGQMIPPQFYAAVAEILAFVFKLKNRQYFPAEA